MGPDDIVQSVCRTFFRRVGGGEFQIPDADALWRLLCAIALTKVRQQARYHHQQKRGLDREQHFDSRCQDGRPGNPELAAKQATPDEAAAFTDQLSQLISELSEYERRLLDLKLQKFTNDEIAERLKCSERTVRRMRKRIQSRRERLFDAV